MGTQLQWLNKMMAMMEGGNQVTIPADYRDRVLAVEDIMTSDTSGIVSSLLDFAINAAISDIVIETSNNTTTKLLNDWLKNLNSNLRGKIPVGYKAFGYQYFYERWLGSSFLLTRTKWVNENGYSIPNNMWLVNGADIVVKESKNKIKHIGDESYYLFIDKENNTRIPNNDNNLLFVQKPFAKWVDNSPVPFIVLRGIYENLVLLKALFSKSYTITDKAEFINLIKKGTEALSKGGDPNFIYDESDLTLVKDGLRKVINDSKTLKGSPTWVTNFDTEMGHIIPDYDKALKGELYSPIERRLLASLGIIDIVQGTASSRKESLLNPKPFMSMIQKGKEDFKVLISDIIETFVEKNKGSHRKIFGKNWEYNIYSSSSSIFMTKELMDHIRAMRDRGQISGRTYVEITGQDFIDFDIENMRIKNEKDKDDLPKLKPVPTSYTDLIAEEKSKQKPEGQPKEEITTLDKTGPEAKNYDKANTELDKLDKKIKEKKLKIATLQEELLEKTLKQSEDVNENTE